MRWSRRWSGRRSSGTTSFSTPLLSALVFAKLFFPSFDPVVGTIAAFGSFAVGYLARPFGAVFFGHFGDRIGRKATLVATLTIMGVGTFVIGLLPTYASIGVWAPILLVAMRFLQGLGVGGEWGGAVLMVVESAPAASAASSARSRNLGVPLGLMLSTAVFKRVAEPAGRTIVLCHGDGACRSC